MNAKDFEDFENELISDKEELEESIEKLEMELKFKNQYLDKIKNYLIIYFNH